MTDRYQLGELTPADCRSILRGAACLVFVDDPDAPVLHEEDAHHLVHVLRLAPGEQVAASDGKCAWRLCRLVPQADADASTSSARARPRERAKLAARLRLEPISARVEAPRSPGTLTIGFALQKGDRPEWTVQKLTELGIDRLLPFFSDRSVVRLDADGARRRGERLRKVAREAAGQARRVVLPEIGDPAPLGEVLAAQSGAVHFAEPGGGPLSSEVSCLFIGPEGGWAPRELALGKELVGLGETVLRAETAAVAAGSLLVALASGLVRLA